MAQRLPPPPSHGTSEDSIPDVWANWLLRLRDYVSTTTSSIAWAVIDKTGSSLSDIVNRAHTLLGSVQGGNATEQYHLTAAQHTDLVDAGDTTLHYHATDRARANHTGTQTLATISDAGTAAAKNTGTSGNTVPLLDGNNTWSGTAIFSGRTAFGSTIVSNCIMTIDANITGGITSIASQVNGAIQNDVTANSFSYNSRPSVAAGTTLSSLVHFRAAHPVALGSGATVSSQYGFVAESNLTQGTNNYGFYGNIASATGSYNFYANGTAWNYFAGNTGIGNTPSSGIKLRIAGAMADATTQYVQRNQVQFNSGTTSGAYGISSELSTQAASFTLPSLRHFSAAGATVGSGSTLTNQYGFIAESSLTTATSNYGFFGNIASATGHWNFYAGGTAANHFTGETTFGTSLGYGRTSGVGGTVTQLTSKATGVTINKICGQITTHNAALAAATNVGFTVTNSTVAATDTIIIHRASGGTAGAYQVWVDSVAAGSFVVYLRNTTAGSLSEAITLNFSIIKATNA